MPADAEDRQLVNAMMEAGEGRNYQVYETRLDSRTLYKADRIVPFLRLSDGDVFVDGGCGTGDLAMLIADMHPGVEVYGQDLTHEYLRHHDRLNPVYGNLEKPCFPPGSVTAKTIVSTMHEVASFGSTGSSTDSTDSVLKSAFIELEDGGVLVLWDFVKPALQSDIYMEIPDPETRELFYRFQKEFSFGNNFPFEEVSIEGKDLIRLRPEWAFEFILHSAYRENWNQELPERYGNDTETEMRKRLEKAGYVNIVSQKETSEYIVKEAMEGKIRLYTYEDSALTQMDMIATHGIWKAEKPGAPPAKHGSADIPSCDYEQLLSTISVHTEGEDPKVDIGDVSFPAEMPPFCGSRQFCFRLKDHPGAVLMIPRGDTRNHHNAFRSLFQIVDRRQILEDYGTPHMKVLDFDRSGPPYRYMVQEAIPEGAVCAADLIRNGKLSEEDVRQMAEIVNRYEEEQVWQLNMKPHLWYRVKAEDGSTQMVYASGKVYHYNDKWAFRRTGLLQWIDPDYCEKADGPGSQLPPAAECQALCDNWADDKREVVQWWRKYLWTERKGRIRRI